MKIKVLLISQLVGITLSTACYFLISARGINSNIVGYPSYTNFNATYFFAFYFSAMIIYPIFSLFSVLILRNYFKNA
jgi:hypothetical protein